MKLGTAALFVLDDEGDMDVILHNNTRARWDDAQDERGPGAGEAHSVHSQQSLRPVGANPASSEPDVFAGVIRREIRSSCARYRSTGSSGT